MNLVWTWLYIEMVRAPIKACTFCMCCCVLYLKKPKKFLGIAALQFQYLLLFFKIIHVSTNIFVKIIFNFRSSSNQWYLYYLIVIMAIS